MLDALEEPGRGKDLGIRSREEQVCACVCPSVRPPVSQSVHARTDREKGRILLGRTREDGKKDFTKSCAMERWDLLVYRLMED